MEKANRIYTRLLSGHLMALTHHFRSERPSSSWSSNITLDKNFCGMVSTVPSSLIINWIWSEGGARQLALAVLHFVGARETRCHYLSPPFPGFYSTTAPLPFSQVSAVCCQLSLAPEQVEQNPHLIWRNKVSGQIASSLAKSTDMEDNMFLPGNTSLLSWICENPANSPLHRAFP